MYSFQNDYSECCHPSITERLSLLGNEAFRGYGADRLCESAAAKIRRAIACPEASIHFLTGGTQTNLTVIASVLRPFEAVIAAETGHINVHETGAIEGTGHKVLTAASSDGKLTPEMILALLASHTDEHMVKPRLVYISDSTELGTVYTKAELTAIYALCRQRELILYLDGARLGAALCASCNDLSLSDLPRLCDIFYIGGTKNGALLGEALVISRPELAEDFRYEMKHRGAMMAKGFLLGLNFDTLFTDGLYLRLAEAAGQQAARLRQGLMDLGIPLMVDSPTNQLFPVLPNHALPCLRRDFAFEIWGPVDEEHTCIRLVTSWATTGEAVDHLLTALESF
ncbi:MAG: aminotransferase class V-fold PLP-dependent enzyme [Lachnospiraceae bacterium]|jgi:threonine aldolase|nr:aminotransferase class V-fold PLP-dependent enzyme [Lachnospiraceae bacterium]